MYANCLFIAFYRTRTVYVVFQSHGFSDVPLVLIMDAWSFQGLDARQHKFRLSEVALL